MNIFARAGLSRPAWGRQILLSLWSLSALFAIWPQNLMAAYQDEDTQAPVEAPPPNTPQTPEQLQQLVAPIALYPDSLVAQILAASTFPEQVVRGRQMGASASRSEGRRSGAGGGPATLGSERQGARCVSVRARKHGQESFLDVIPGRRLLQSATGCDECHASDAPAGASRRAILKHAAANRGRRRTRTIVIEPANPDVVYVPAYDPWVVYG